MLNMYFKLNVSVPCIQMFSVNWISTSVAHLSRVLYKRKTMAASENGQIRQVSVSWICISEWLHQEHAFWAISLISQVSGGEGRGEGECKLLYSVMPVEYESMTQIYYTWKWIFACHERSQIGIKPWYVVETGLHAIDSSIYGSKNFGPVKVL